MTDTIKVGETQAVPLVTHWELDNAREPCLLWIGVWAPTYFVAASLESGIELAAQWAEENAPGLLTEPDYPECNGQGVCVECQTLEDSPEPCEHVEDAECDLAYCDPGLWVASWEWGGILLHGDELTEAMAGLLEQETSEVEL